MESTNHDELAPTTIASARTGGSRYTRQYKDEVLAAYETSGMTARAFSHCRGLKYKTFLGWINRRPSSKAQSPASTEDRRFILADLEATGGTEGMRIELPGGAHALLTAASQADLLAALIKALSR